ncbi:EAL domain-containing protein [Thermosynechococcus sp. HN-54]|uniref:EAL domain-containing protein n=1 Tax=Thermosynechococcus sp. HN-54 TaxID=2933959 RepID=UPI00202CD1B1|nr:EAL domain-containing protein [Thermosynechococcus sp. HN-54]URR36327.1 EAL domain-containing protein [Thermosynechococcus sp. HN-54]
MDSSSLPSSAFGSSSLAVCTQRLLHLVRTRIGTDVKHYLAAVLSALPVGVALYDVTGQIVYMNPAGRVLLGVRDPEVTASQICAELRIFYCGSDRPYPKEALPGVQALQGRILPPLEVEVEYGDRRLTVEVQASPIFDPQGQVQFSISTFWDISTRKRSEIEQQVLKNYWQEQANRYYDIVQTQTDFILRSRADTIITFANDAFCRLFNRPATEVIGYPWSEFVLPEDLPPLLEKVAQLSPSAPSFANENRVHHPQQGFRWTQWINLGIFDAEGNLQEIQSVGRDVTALKEQLLREQALNRVIQSIRNSLDLDTIFETAVREVAQLGLGFDAFVVEYLAQQQVWRYVAEYHHDPNFPNRIGFEIPDRDNPFAADLKAGNIVSIADTSEITDPINQEIAAVFPGAWLLIPLIVEDRIWGSLTLFAPQQRHEWSAAEISLARAISTQLEVAIYQATLYQRAQQELAERRRIEAVLRESEERFRLTATNVPGAIFRYIHYPDGRNQVFYLNPMCEQLWGVPAEVVAEDSSVLWNMVHPEDRPAMWESVLESARTLQPWFWQWRICYANGDIRWVEGAGQPEQLPDGAVMWYTLILDVTERYLAETRLKEQQAQLDLAARASNIGFYFCDLRTGTSYVSPTYKTQLGYPPTAEEASPKDWEERLHPQDRDRAIEAYRKFLRGEAEYDIDFRLRHRDGSYRWFHSDAVLIHDEHGQPCKVVGTHIDITDRKATELALRESEERYRLLAENINDIVALYDLQWQCLYVSPSCETLLGIPAERIVGQHFAQLCCDRERSRVIQDLQQMIQQQKFWPITYQACTAQGEILWLETLVKPRYDSQGQLQQLQTTSRDVTSRVRVQMQLHHEAYHDSLTGLPNRLYFMEQLETAITQARMNPNFHYGVLFLDMDRFKVINDSLGHAVGDRILVAFAALLRNLIDQNYTVARFGGDEFVILATGLSEIQGAIALCERIIHRLQIPLIVDDRQIFISSSIGVVFAQNEYQHGLEVLRNADIAMYQAKTHQKGGYALFNCEMYEQVLERLHLEHDLRHALNRHQLRVLYQPFFNLQTQQLAGMEALVRWQHPERGLVSPAQFIPIAEDTGLIVALDQWVLEHACQQFWTWKQQYETATDLVLSVNVSAKTLKHPSFLNHVDVVRQKYPFPKGQLVLELTESMAIELGSDMLSLLQALGDRDIDISIDDFGTGYSCLSYLHSLPIQHLKVDRSFVSQLEQNERNFQITQMILVLTHQLGYRAIAEGIETHEQLQTLRQLGCDYGQGYLFARPMPPEALESLLKAH